MKLLQPADFARAMAARVVPLDIDGHDQSSGSPALTAFSMPRFIPYTTSPRETASDGAARMTPGGGYLALPFGVFFYWDGVRTGTEIYDLGSMRGRKPLNHVDELSALA